jgi:Homing endonuclease associated repeat
MALADLSQAAQPDREPFIVQRVRPRSGVRPRWGPAREAGAQVILDAIQRWNELYGQPPTLADWEPSRARRLGQDWRAHRWERGDWPSTRVVRSHFGTMSAAIRAAGLPARSSPARRRRHLASPETVLDAIKAWHARDGEPPAMTDWDPARARRDGQEWRIARFYEGDWPSIATVRHHFGTLNRAVLAAGLSPPPSRSACGAEATPAGAPRR